MFNRRAAIPSFNHFDQNFVNFLDVYIHNGLYGTDRVSFNISDKKDVLFCLRAWILRVGNYVL